MVEDSLVCRREYAPQNGNLPQLGLKILNLESIDKHPNQKHISTPGKVVRLPRAES